MIEGLIVFIKDVGADMKNAVQKTGLKHLLGSTLHLNLTAVQQDNLVGIFQGQI